MTDMRLLDVEPTGPPAIPVIVNPPGRAVRGQNCCGNCFHRHTHRGGYHHCGLIETKRATREHALRPGYYLRQVNLSTVACQQWEAAE